MNLIDATIVDRAGELHAVADGLDAPLGLPAGAASWPRAVTVGIRPERLHFDTPDARLRGVVTAIENLGGDEIVHISVGATSLAVRAPRPVPVRVGDATGLDVDPRDLHLFESGTGCRLLWRPPHEHGASVPEASSCQWPEPGH